MKTILIVIAGMGDLPDAATLRETPLSVASIPSLDMLARRGDITVVPTVVPDQEISHKNALLTLLGYDLQRGEPSLEDLMEFGLNGEGSLTSYASLRPFIIPGFSGHGVCVTPSAWVRGVAKCALLNPLDIYSPGSSDVELLEAMADLACHSVIENEFVLVYVDSPLKASLKGDYQGKIKALELIDRHLVTPVADFVWKSDLFINLAVATDLVTPWHRRRPTLISVPALLYFNNHDREGDSELHFTEVTAMLNNRMMRTPSDFIRYLSHFEVEDLPEADLPF